MKCLTRICNTVADIGRSHKFYEELFGAKFDLNSKGRCFDLLKVGISCWFVQWNYKKNLLDKFNEKRVGLDHVAFEIRDVKELEKITQRLQKMKVKTAGIEKFADKYPYVCFRDPDNIQVEFFISNPK